MRTRVVAALVAAVIVVVLALALGTNRPENIHTFSGQVGSGAPSGGQTITP